MGLLRRHSTPSIGRSAGFRDGGAPEFSNTSFWHIASFEMQRCRYGRAAATKSRDGLLVGESEGSRPDPRPGALANLNSYVPEASASASARLRSAPQQFSGKDLQSVTATAESP